MFNDILGTSKPTENPCKDIKVHEEGMIVEEHECDCDGNCGPNCSCNGHDDDAVCEGCGNIESECDCDENDQCDEDLWSAATGGGCHPHNPDCGGCEGC
jgi:hypothetical protein